MYVCVMHVHEYSCLQVYGTCVCVCVFVSMWRHDLHAGTQPYAGTHALPFYLQRQDLLNPELSNMASISQPAP